MWTVFAVTLIASLALTPLARRFAAAGGLAVFAAMALGLALARWWGVAWHPGFADLSWVVLIASSLVCLLGWVDESRDLPATWKLWWQTIAVAPVVLAGWLCETMGVVDRLVLLGHRIELGWLGVPLTVVWLVGWINALRLLDGKDGVASLAGLSAAAALVIVASTLGQGHVVLTAVALAGALAGFLTYNLPPARIQLGGSGSMVIGLVLGILSIQALLTTAATLSICATAPTADGPRHDEATVQSRLDAQPRRH